MPLYIVSLKLSLKRKRQHLLSKSEFPLPLLQRHGYAHASAVKLYNILNGVFTMAFLDDSIPLNPMLKVKRPAPRKDEKKQEEGDKALTVQELSRVLSSVKQEPLKWQAYINCC